MGGVSIVLYVAMNYSSNGIGVIADSVTALGLFIAFYYGLTGFACVWYYRKNLTSSARNLFMQGILPLLGGLILWFLGGWSVWLDYDVATENDYTIVDRPRPALAGRRRLRHRRRGRAGRARRLPLLPVHQPRAAVLQEADADQGHPDPGPGRVGTGQEPASGALRLRPERPFKMAGVLDDAEISRVLAITAHPDDVDFSAAGTVARWTEAGLEVVYCIVTDGDAGGIDELPPGGHGRLCAGPSRWPRPSASACTTCGSSATPTAGWRPRWTCAGTWPG